jgi:hypothetical protein
MYNVGWVFLNGGSGKMEEFKNRKTFLGFAFPGSPWKLFRWIVFPVSTSSGGRKKKLFEQRELTPEMRTCQQWQVPP